MWVILNDENGRGGQKSIQNVKGEKILKGMLFGQKGLLHDTQQLRIPLRGIERRRGAGRMEE